MLLFRYKQTGEYTRGVLLFENRNFVHTLERPWLNNKKNSSCVPAGYYQVLPLARSGSGKYKNVFHILAVMGRSGILIHNGNTVSHTLGCILVGLKPGTLAGKPAVLQSRSAMAVLRNNFDPELTIWSREND